MFLDTSRGTNEAWVSRQRLQNAYQKLLVMDLEFALDKKVEQELYVEFFDAFHISYKKCFVWRLT